MIESAEDAAKYVEEITEKMLEAQKITEEVGLVRESAIFIAIATAFNHSNEAILTLSDTMHVFMLTLAQETNSGENNEKLN